ncbi:MAG: hypothetical protein JO112_23565, partial [Planctomycetes bacterium]|nr:hypothetical protein [Planctomycetota bacterium]
HYATAAEALDPEQAGELWDHGWEALQEAAAAQSIHQEDAEPTGHFLRLLAAALASGRAHVAAPEGMAPAEGPEGWGWRGDPAGSWQPQGKRIGWVDGAALYLEPEAAFAAAQELAREQGDSLPVGARTLHRRLREKGLLVETDGARGTNTVRKSLAGRRREVLFLRASALSPCSGTDQTDQAPENPERNGVSAGQFAPP